MNVNSNIFGDGDGHSRFGTLNKIILCISCSSDIWSFGYMRYSITRALIHGNTCAR